MIYAISDIHGYYREIYRWFDQMGNLAPFENGANKLVLLGDYVDYGADSFKVLRGDSCGNLVSSGCPCGPAGRP